LSGQPSDMDWTVDASGKVQAWFFEDAHEPRLVRCELQQMRLAQCAQVLAGAGLKAQQGSLAVHFAVDLQGQRVFIADARGHKVRALALDGGRVLAESGEGQLFFPNRLRLDPQGRLVVADNDNHRLVWLEVRGATPRMLQLQSLQVLAHPDARRSHTRAADFAMLSGANGEPEALWVLALASGQKNGDALVWGPGRMPMGRADLGGWTDPLVIEAFGPAAVVADFDGVALYRLGRRGEYLGAFGDESFQAELQASRDRLREGSLLEKLGWVSLAATLAVGFLLAWRYGERPGMGAVREAFANLEPSLAEVPGSTVELAPAAWYNRQIQWASVGMMTLMLAVVAMLVFVFPHQIPSGWRHDPRIWAAGASVLVIVVLLPVTLWWVLGVMARRVVLTAAGEVQIHSGKRMLASMPVREVIASAQALLVGRVALQYRLAAAFRGPQRWIYDEDQLTRYVLARLPAANRVTQQEMVRAMLKRMPLAQQLAIGVPLLLWLALELWRALAK
ncbi:MAG TPA: hypothetical protein VFH35_02645, partial [Ramlibacter sp.]|nr:hypothetical protein [Ramlibacter sp.]